MSSRLCDGCTPERCCRPLDGMRCPDGPWKKGKDMLTPGEVAQVKRVIEEVWGSQGALIPPPPKREAKPIPLWVDGYGNSRTADAMTTDHLWNVIGFIRDRVKLETSPVPVSIRLKNNSFYWAAIEELRKRGIL